MPKLREWFDPESQDLIIEIRISNHEIANASLDEKAVSKICELDKEDAIVSKIKAILATIDYLEQIEKHDGQNFQNTFNVNPNGIYTSYSTASASKHWWKP